MWLVLGGALVFFMHSGFSLLEVGSVSVRNTQNILFKNIISPTVAGILFWFCGYSFAYVRHLTCFTCFTRLGHSKAGMSDDFRVTVLAVSRPFVLC